MVMDNICFVLNSFLRCSAYENIVFCWVMHEQAIIDEIAARLDLSACTLHSISLICGEDALRIRLQGDVSAGIREEDVILRSIERTPLYERLNTYKIDVSAITPEDAADLILQRCNEAPASKA
jgi:hypothetical protein